MRRALIFITFRQWQNHKVRAAITLISVALGVSTYFAVRTANQSLQQSFEDTVDRMAGKATLQVTSGGSGFSEDVLETVRATPGVTEATAVVQEFCAFESENHWDAYNRNRFLVFGVDPKGEQKLRGPLPYGFAFLRLPGTIAVSSLLAAQHHLKPGDRTIILTPEGKTSLRILSVFKAEGIGELFGGRVAVMDIHTAQAAFTRGRRIDRIDLVTYPSVDIESVRQNLKDHLAPGLDVERPRARSQELEDATVLIRRGFVLTSLVALLVSSFLIFNAMSITVNQRWKEIGVLRALGVPQRYMRMSFLVEAGLMGLIGSALGIAAGFYLALIFGGLTGHVSNVLSSTVVQIAVPGRPRFDATFVLQSIAIGIAVSAISAWLPARSAAKLNPILALHNIENRQTEVMVGKLRMAIGASLILLGFLAVRFTTAQVGTMFSLSYVALIFLGFVIILPGVSCRASSALRPLADRLFGSPGIMALDSIINAPRRTSATVGAVMVGLAFVFSNWAILQSEKQELTRSFAREINFDLSVFSFAPMAEDVAARVASIPGVKRVAPYSSVAAYYRGQIAGTKAMDMALWFARPGRTLAAGDFDRSRILAPKGEGVLISQRFAARWSLKLGDILSLDTPSGKLERPVLGFVDENGWFEGTVFMDRALFKQYWPNEKIAWLNIDLKPDADPNAVKQQIEQISSKGQPLMTQTADQVRRDVSENIRATIDQIFGFFYVQMFIATFVGAVGIVNTLVISVWDRRREIGIIRSVGGTRGQVARIILLEAAALVLIGLASGIAKGLLDTYFMTRTAARVFAGYTVPFYFPIGLILLSVPVVTIVALGSALWPARLAARTNVIDSIGSE